MITNIKQYNALRKTEKSRIEMIMVRKELIQKYIDFPEKHKALLHAIKLYNRGALCDDFQFFEAKLKMMNKHIENFCCVVQHYNELKQYYQSVLNLKSQNDINLQNTKISTERFFGTVEKKSKEEMLKMYEDQAADYRKQVSELEKISTFAGVYIQERVFPFIQEMTNKKYKEMFLGLCKDKISSISKFKQFWLTFTKKIEEAPVVTKEEQDIQNQI